MATETGPYTARESYMTAAASHALIRGLLCELPDLHWNSRGPAWGEWTEDEMLVWLALAEATLRVLYRIERSA